MEKWLCLGALGVGALLFLIFLLDLVAGFPFSGAVPEGEDSPFMLVDIAGLLASGIVAYLGWNAYKDIK